MLTKEENELLARVEGDAPMGQLMRRHWIPALLTEEIPDSDGAPVPVKLFGEELVAWRDSDGRVGLMDRYCPHRRASLVFGRNEDCGLRCLYHGWKVDVEGKVVEMPSEPVEACKNNNVNHKAYATHEHCGIVWAWMGAKEDMPEFEPPPFAPTKDAKVSIVKIQIDCNWAQILEGAIDSAHSSTLHSTDMTPAHGEARATSSGWLRPTTDKAPRLQVQPTTYGFKYAAIRRPIANANTHEYIRMSLFVAPFTVMIPPNSAYNVANINVPIDDTHTMFHFIAWTESAAGGIDQEEWRKFCGAQIGIDVDSSYRKFRVLENNYKQDRILMKTGASFTGIRGIPNQDIAMWETMGPIADRTNDRLGASDQAIVEFRRVMVEAVKNFRDGSPAIGTRTAVANTESPFIEQATLRSFEGVVPKGTEWRDLDNSEAQKARANEAKAASASSSSQAKPKETTAA